MWSLSLIALPSLLVSSVLAQDGSECQVYSDPDVISHLSEFPKAWDPAHILPTDSAGQDKWNSIKDSGGPDGDFTKFRATYPASDPDCWWSFKQCIRDGDVAKVPEPKSIGFGFDDGPYCAHDPFYDFLQQNNQKATMFYIGSHVLNWPRQAKRGAEDGHELCVHTWSHRHMTTLSSEDAFAELWYTIELVTGVKTDCWRPPEGDVDDRIRAIAKGLGLKTILWKYDSQDWQVKAGTATPEQVDSNYQHFIDAAKNGTFDKEGAILLQHENNNYTMSEAMKWYPMMKEAFKNVVPVRVALASDYVPPANSGNETTSVGSSASSPVQPPASAASGFTSIPATQTTTGGANAPTGNTTSSGNTSSGSNGASALPVVPSALLGLAVISFSALIL